MTSAQLDLSRHPCFNPLAKGSFGRVHLPVAPKCNIKCNYCNRKYDCVNESRPGVTSTVLTPAQAVEYVGRVLAREPRISVAGIAGPGDPFANGEETMDTLRLLRRGFPEIILCLASNGMNIGPCIPELGELKVSHVTVTVNAVDPEIGARIYGWVKDGKVAYRGREGAELLLARQLAAVRELKGHGITVKINSILIPGINDHHIEDVAARMRELGADLFNCMAMFPNLDTPFAAIPQPDAARMEEVREAAEKHLPQMRHCARCRADAVGLLDSDRSGEFRGCLSACASLPPAGTPRAYVAVATREGILVNRHLGEAEAFEIWEQAETGYRLVEQRPAPKPGGGLRRWLRLARLLGDCRAVLCSGIGETPRETLEKTGVRTVVMEGFIETGLAAIYEGGNPEVFKTRSTPCGGRSCAGSGGGCV
ncbi:MAG: radical SAM protein [Desulfobulbaceae bacterium]